MFSLKYFFVKVDGYTIIVSDFFVRVAQMAPGGLE